MTQSEQSKYIIRAGQLAHGAYELDLTPERAGWEWSSLRVLALQPGQEAELPAGEHEFLILPLSGGCTVTAGGRTFAGSAAEPGRQQRGWWPSPRSLTCS